MRYDNIENFDKSFIINALYMQADIYFNLSPNVYIKVNKDKYYTFMLYVNNERLLASSYNEENINIDSIRFMFLQRIESQKNGLKKALKKIKGV